MEKCYNVQGVYEPGTPAACNHTVPSIQLSRVSVSPRLPANRAQGSAGPDTPFRPTHRGGRSANGPTTVRAALRLHERPCRLRRANCPRERISIARGARGQRPRQVVSELGTTAGKRLEAGAGEWRPPSTGQSRPGGRVARQEERHCGRILDHRRDRANHTI